MLLAATAVQAQVNIGGKVFGGARQADVKGHTFVNIGADHHDVIINAVYGGNDISGTIGSSSVPTALTGATANGITDDYNAFVLTNEEATGKHLFIGQLFAGGYGNYKYTPNNGKYDVTIHGTTTSVANGIDNIPNLQKAYIELTGGTFGYVYGGGDSVTVANKTDICIDNTSIPWDLRGVDGTVGTDDDAISDSELQGMGINTEYFDQTGTYHFSRVFGGNNKADMSIRPTWHFEKGSIENLYSGGNEGRMISQVGLLLEIDPTGSEDDKKKLIIDNVYGGCRKADVHPLNPAGGEVDEYQVRLPETITVQNEEGEDVEVPKYNFPDGLSARVIVRGGDINNVYGGNDVAGRVYGGNAVGVYTSIRGSIYGGGNGSYPYTDNRALLKNPHYSDFFYDVRKAYNLDEDDDFTSAQSAAVLNDYRPNAEQVSILVKGQVVGEGNSQVIVPTVIGGGIFCGGNSATLKNTTKTNPMVEMKFGSYVIAEKVFLGNNGEYMKQSTNDNDVLQLYAKYVDANGVIYEENGTGRTKFNSMTLVGSGNVFDKYMDGCALDLMPSVEFYDDYIPYSTYIGSFFCGGNVGSMTKKEKTTITFREPIIVYNKVVGGCNDAYISATDYNAAYRGGIIGSDGTNGTPNERTSFTDASGNIKDRLELNFNGLKIQPLRMRIDGTDDNAGTPNTLITPSNFPLVWNTIKLGERDANGKPVPVAWDALWKEGTDEIHTALYNSTVNRRFTDGNIYGGCCNSGVVNGNVIINVNATVVDRTGEHGVFDEVTADTETGEDKLYNYGYDFTTHYKQVSGVLLGQQGMDVLGSALNIFGGGKGEETEIWGSATVNLNKGYVFQIFGGSEQGAIGKRTSETKDTYGRYPYTYNDKYSTYVNLSGMTTKPGKPKSQDMTEDLAEAEFLYGGGFIGMIAGNTRINLGNGRIFNSFAGSCNADILGHTETYIGKVVGKDGNEIYGFPYVRDYVYGGNDLGGKIKGNANFLSRLRCKDDNDDSNDAAYLAKIHKTDMLNASAYIEYIQGRVEKIYGGCYGVYDYTDPLFGDYFYATGGTGTTSENLGKARTDKGYSKPSLGNAFVNFRPDNNNNEYHTVNTIYGAGQGYFGEPEENTMQESSYILIDIPQASANFQSLEVFGAGECGGVGMGVAKATADAEATAHKASAIIDLLSGDIKTAYGGSYKEGVTRRTVVNVPTGSTIAINSIFGGAYGTDTYHPCDVYEANVNYWGSEHAKVTNAIYGGNNNERRTIYGKVNIYGPVYSGVTSGEGDNLVKYTSTVYGAGRGKNTWSEYTEVNLENNASVYEVYGGGEAGKVHNAESVQKFMNAYKPAIWPKEKESDPDVAFTDADWKYAWTLGVGYDPAEFDFSSTSTSYMNNPVTNLKNLLTREAEMEDRNYLSEGDANYKRYNTNVLIKQGATVGGYAYGGGLGEDAVVAGTTYIALLGGKVAKDLYAAGTSGSVEDLHQAKNFTASANAYIEGGSARNVYGGGWKGSVGHHAGVVRNKGQENEYIDYLDAPYYDTDTHELIDIPGETHVVIGILKENLETVPSGQPDYHFYNGIPAIERNAYGGGEGGAVWGTTYVTMNNGYIGYQYHTASESGWADDVTTVKIDERYEEKIEDDTYKDEDGHFQENRRLDDAGCIFGGGYIDNSSVDFTNVTMYGGHVRNALFGGGEIAAIGRGKIQETMVEGKAVRSLQGIYRPGSTLIELYDGHVHRNVFGGGRGYNNLGEGGKLSLFSDGYVFGQTLVHIHGGEIGTEDELLAGNGNVFGGGDIGYVYSAYEYIDDHGHKMPRKGVKSGVRYDGDGMYQGYYYEHVWDNSDDNNPDFIHYSNGIENQGGTERKLTEDCKVLIAPHCKVTAAGGIDLTIKYDEGQVVSAHDFYYIQDHPSEFSGWLTGSTPKVNAYRKVLAEGGISFTRHYNKGQYVQTSALHTLGNKEDDTWEDLEANTNDDGIIIHNAVFAGGNTSSKGSDDVNAYANSTSVFGNATASIHDVYHRDLVTIGTGHIGGLYGDGNLTLVDGYRGLNITNYGTDYNYLYEEENMKELTKAQYDNLLDREKDYYELRYKCILACTDDDGTHYFPEGGDHTKASTLTGDDILTLFAKQNGENGTVNMFATDANGNKIPNPTYWAQNGVCSIYAGRILNTIQRADFCGVFGSRLVLQGAQDRVPEVVDYTKYTINRVREVSLNKKYSVRNEEADTEASPEKIRKRKMHGNYFGIYNIVNYLGALTSDFDFGDQGTEADADDAAGRVTNSDGTFSILPGYKDVGTGDIRTSDNINEGTYGPQYTGQTFYGWKRFHHDDQTRNNGNSHNKVALASGVYLELTTEESIGKELNEKVWGLITGVVELDLINVQQGMGGGFVYAKNVHGKRTKSNLNNTTLTALNAGAVTRWDYTYSTTEDDDNQRKWQTSGNFVHSTQTIIDDCYNVSNKYMGTDKVPAHYWYIKGSVYVYDQYISAYTGATNAYSEVVDIPLTITAASHGNMRLLNVQPNLYAYKNTNGEKLSGEQKLVINDVEYTLNTPISYWDWYKLTAAEKNLFVEETMVCIADGTVGGITYTKGDVILPVDTTNTAKAKVGVLANGDACYWGDILRSSNNLSHGTGYILTYKVNNPTDWDTWYTEYFDSSNTPTPREKNQDKDALHDDMIGDVHKGPNDGPTYRLKSTTGALLGQRDYKVSDLISEDVVTTYQAINSSHIPSSGQAVFSRAYVATGETDITRTGQSVHLYKGSTMSATEASGVSNVAQAWICTKTIRLNSTDNLYINSVMTETEKNTHLANVTNAIRTLVGEINDIIDEYNSTHTDNPISTIDEGISDINSLTAAQQNKITALQKKELSDLLMRKKDIANNIVPAYYCTTAGLYGGNYYESGINYRGLEAWSSMDEKDRAKFTFNYDAFDLLIDPAFSRQEGEKYQYDGSTYTTEAQVKDQTSGNPAGYSIEKPVDYTATYNGDGITLPTGVTVTTLNSTTPKNTLANGDELSRTVFEGLPNEQRHYAPLTVTSADVEGGKICTFYVVNTPLMIGPTPYTTGNLISKDDYDGLYSTNPELNQQGKVTKLEYTAPGTYYFCRDAYDDVTVGTVISSGEYEHLTNLQKNFTIHGIAPTETSTLYVSRFSDIDDLSTEKIITVIYEYNYEESDVSGAHITPVTERHVLNIHINFKTGAPIVEDIEAPQIILPGTLLALIPPHVIEGASPIQGGGWELYPTESDADNHNGVEYIPDIDPLYWYQHGYWLRYYALSYVGGKTYSNKVQVSVANYHDLKEVMEDKEHHYYIDIPNLNRLREPKIYINDATDGMNQLKNLFDLSLLTTTPTGTLAGHSLLNSQVKACGNLEFIMRTNVNHTGSWTSIGGGTDPCFEGVFHGDGHYISGLSQSLFGKLCGEVYNLGVMGSFTSAGIADTGSGYVENCWVKSSATSGWANGVQAVFGDPNRAEYTPVPSGTKLTAGQKYYTSSTGGEEHTATGEEAESNGSNYYIKRSIVQLVNCYYPVGNEYKVKENANRGAATQMPVEAFYNGTVAYDLNGFYLYKRYRDHSGLTSTDGYNYFTIENLAEATPTPSNAYYGTGDTKLCSSGAGVWNKGYVEDRFADGDFRYAGGEIPTEVDERLYTDIGDNGKTKFYPIWPDDYLFFGQMLTYDWNELRPHEEVPSPITKNSGRLHNSDMSNRVYRAPAYYRNKTIGVAHFNPAVNLVAYSKPENSIDTKMKKAYPGMTAIDFKGHHDVDDGGFTLGWASHTESSPYWSLSAEGKYFYPPLLDDDGLISIVNRDETPNLLAYAPLESDNQKTFDVLTAYFTEPAYSDYYQDDDKYRCVNAAPTQNIFGHLVQGTLTATNDHLLVDEQDFNCPISYDFIGDTDEDTHDGTHMWYQRKPKIYVEPVWNDTKRTTKGWEAISLPFTAELVTTVKKGEITHFYSGSEESKNGTNTKLGHEYWLREYRDISEVTEDKLDLPEGATSEQIAAALKEAKAEALFTYPDSKDVLKEVSGVWQGWEELMDKEMKNSFLWDYYYYNSNALSGTDENEDPYDNHHKDKNLDEYQTYYKPNASGVVNTFDDYTLLTKGVPYIIGFPGNKFYEFDLSGGNDGFEATTTADENPEKLAEQMITFVSKDGYSVGVSDDELAYMTPHVTHNGYIFHPNYLNEKVKEGSTDAQGTITYKLDNGTTEGVTIYTLKADGSSYDLPQSSAGSTAPVAAPVAFRPYFTANGGARPVTRSIIFNNEDTELKGVEEKGDPRSDEATGSLMIYAKRHKIVVESALTYTTDVRIVNTAGITINVFTIEPGETIETRIYNSGVYIVLTTDGHYTKKLSVR